MKNVLISYRANNYASRCVLAGIQKFVERTGDWITRVVSFPEILTADMVRRAPSDGFDGILLPDVRQADVARAVVESPLPVSLTATRSGQNAVLRWNNAGNCEYEIYYAPKKNGRFLCIGTTKGTTFTAGAYPHGSRACFKVKACVRSDTGTLSTQSSEIRSVNF